jgi:hypothetical protein
MFMSSYTRTRCTVRQRSRHDHFALDPLDRAAADPDHLGGLQYPGALSELLSHPVLDLGIDPWPTVRPSRFGAVLLRARDAGR